MLIICQYFVFVPFLFEHANAPVHKVSTIQMKFWCRGTWLTCTEPLTSTPSVSVPTPLGRTGLPAVSQTLSPSLRHHCCSYGWMKAKSLQHRLQTLLESLKPEVCFSSRWVMMVWFWYDYNYFSVFFFSYCALRLLEKVHQSSLFVPRVKSMLQEEGTDGFRVWSLHWFVREMDGSVSDGFINQWTHQTMSKQRDWWTGRKDWLTDPDKILTNKIFP